MSSPQRISPKRVYELPSDADGCRVLVERLWPRGLSKQRAKIDFWSKETAPSPELRRWFNHEADKWVEFKRADTLSSYEAWESRSRAFSSVSEAVESPSSTPRGRLASTTP
jgi:uncharacterized protein YeaO (DUF488 family)